MTTIFDLGILAAGWLIAQVVFNGFEAHVPWAKRLTKFAVIFMVFLAVRLWIGRGVFYGLLGLMTGGIAFLHGYWFNYRNGIHWRKAEPRDRYLELIGEASEKD